MKVGQDWFRALFEHSGDAWVVVDEEGSVMAANRAALALLGYHEPALLAERRIGHLVSGPGIPWVAGAAPPAGVQELIGHRADGRPIPLDAVFSPFEAEGVRQVGVMLRDATDRAGLRESAARLHSVVDTAVDGIIVAGSDGRIVFANPASVAMFGYGTPEEMVGRDLGMLMPQAMAARHGAYMAGHDSGRGVRAIGVPGRELTAKAADGHEFPIDLSVGAFMVGGERFFTGVLRDATARRAAQMGQELLKREVDHRAKNALAVALSLVRLSPRDNAERFAAAVEGRIAAMARAHSLLATEEWGGADLRALAEGEVATHANQVELKGPRVRLAPAGVQPLAMALHELATNAVKHGALSRPEGRVRLSWVFAAPDWKLHLDWRETGGPPIPGPPANEGFGSRLLSSLARHQLRGDLRLDWRPEGLHAVLTLGRERAMPDAAGATMPAGSSAAPSIPPVATPPGRPRVLVVEDELLVALELEAMLARLGCQVVGPARTLTEAVRLAAIEPDLAAAVLDVNLDGERVFPVADMLAARGVPILFATGYGGNDSLAGRDAKAVAVLRKPYAQEAMIAAIGQALRGGAAH